MRSTFEELLKISAPRTASGEPAVQMELDAVVAKSRAQARSQIRRRLGLGSLAIPALLVPVIALSTTGGTNVRQVPDFSIPISYTTDAGKSVSCTVEFFNGETNYVDTNTAALRYLRTQNWSGVGQKIYDLALTYEGDANAKGYSAWSRAEAELIGKTVPASTLRPGDGGFGTNDSDCSGILH